MKRLLILVLLTSALCGQKAPLALPLRQITELQGAMSNQLTGFGLVTGLNNSGSGSKVTRQACRGDEVHSVTNDEWNTFNTP